MINIKLTSRDLRLLNDLYKNSFMAFYQIKEMHFNNKADSTIYNRLSKLIRADVIKSIRVNLIAIHKENMDIGVIYSLTNKGLSLLKEYSYKEINRSVPIPINLSQLSHDLILTDVLRKLGGINLKLYGYRANLDEQIPDAIIHKENNKCAIEVELTAKSNLRYREILSNYMTSNKYSEVLYVVKNKAIETKIKNILLENYNTSFYENDSGKFSFVTLKEFFRDNEINKRRHALEL